MKPEQAEIARLKREVAKLKAERDILGRGLLREGIDVKFGFKASPLPPRALPRNRAAQPCRPRSRCIRSSNIFFFIALAEPA
jgi:hypothetical protein